MGELDAGRAAAEHHQSLGHGLHPGRLVRSPDAVELCQAGHRGNERVGAVGEDDMLGGVGHAVDLDHPGSGEAAAPAQQRDLVVGQPLGGPGVGVVGDHEVAPLQRGSHVDLGGRRCLASAVHRFAGAKQRL